MGAVEGGGLREIVCPLCSCRVGKRLTAFESHLVGEHDTTTKELWDSLHGPTTCACGCGGEPRWNGWWSGYSRVINGHNGAIYAVHGPEEAGEISRRRSESLRGKVGWSRGLTKETDERVRRRGEATSRGRKEAFEAGALRQWNEGLSKETDTRVARGAERLRDMFETGELTPWARGLSKETDDRVARMATNVSLTLQRKEMRDRLDAMKRLDLEEVRARIESSGDFEVIDGLQNYVNRASKVIIVGCKTCGAVSQGSINSLWNGRCFSCAPGGSKAQEEVFRFVRSLGVDAVKNDRRTIPGFELDVFCPESRVAVEYNGLYWHSHVNKSSTYHDNKTEACRRAGIRLIHVFEDEWRDGGGPIRSHIKGVLGKKSSPGGVTWRSIDVKVARDRMKVWHPDGPAAGLMSAFGGFLEGKPVGVVGLRRISHGSRRGDVELCRLCSDEETSLTMRDRERLIEEVGPWARGSGFERIVRTSEVRLGDEETGWTSLGFLRVKRRPIEWWWTDFTHRFNRFKYRADRSLGMSEAAVAEEAGVVKIWGCQNVVYTLAV